ncbi:hypothetical protein FACS1894155_08380 [Bacteroidia bacterium]|nr:hypothetical protein FACS1894155_08380 [Bacteroidia bacterium]
MKKKVYPVITAKPDCAKDAADDFLEKDEREFDVFFFDLPGTVNARGIFKSIMNMDYIFTPIIPDRMAMQSSMSFVTAIQDFMAANPNVPLRGIHVFWNRVKESAKFVPYPLPFFILLQLNLLTIIFLNKKCKGTKK